MKQKWRIGEIAKLFDVSLDTLRYYEKEGLLSPGKRAENGYRYYVYEDLMKIMDILFFRTMELPVREIRDILLQRDIGGIKQVLRENECLLEKRIQEMTALKAMVARNAAQCELCESQFGRFTFTSAPAFMYKLVEEPQDDFVALLRRYGKEDLLHDRIQCILAIEKEQLGKDRAIESALFGLAVEAEFLPLLAPAERCQLESMRPGTYLYTVMATDYMDVRNPVIDGALAYIEAAGRIAVGPLLARYVATVNRDGLDYYEVWIETGTA